MARTLPAVETGAYVDGVPPLILHDEDREQIAAALASVLLAALADDEREGEAR